MLNYSVLEQAATFLAGESVAAPPAAPVVEALLQAEKSAKQQKKSYSFGQLIGNWRLGFITGTKKTRQRAGIVLGAGRYLPKWIEIQLSYAATPNPTPAAIETGTVENSVRIGGLKLVVSGPVKFLNKKNILAFDFTRITVKLLATTLYQGFIRGGELKEKDFLQESVGKQAFFAYFLIDNKFIAARGRGGGLAVWVRSE